MSFLALAIVPGLIVDQVHVDDRIKRCGTVLHPPSKNTAYWFDGQRGWVYLHDASAKAIWWKDQAGYTTGPTLEVALRHMNLNAVVLSCFSEGILTHVAPMVAGRRFASADHNKGGEAAVRAAGIPYCVSPVEGEDANDLHARGGLLAVCQLMMDLIGAERG